MKAEIKRINGLPTVTVDEEPLTQFAYTSVYSDNIKNYTASVAATGPKLFFVLNWLFFGDNERKRQLSVQIENWLSVCPDGYIMIRLGLYAPKSWINAHPEEWVSYSDNKKRPCWCGDGFCSFSSDVWREYIKSEIENFVKELEDIPHNERIIGLFITSGGSDEWYYPCMMRDDEMTTDYSRPFKRFYSGWLREKYKTEDKLRALWKMSDASFENPHIPSQIERFHIEKAEREFINDVYSCEEPSYRTVREIFDGKRPNIGTFLNANAYKSSADYYDALHDATATTIVSFAKKIKKLKPDYLVGAFYGYFGCTDFYEGSNACGLMKLLESEYIDIIGAPPTYNNRQPGGYATDRVMLDSIALHGKVFFCESDTRTHLSASKLERNGFGLYSMEDSLSVIKRDYARTLTQTNYAWWLILDHFWYNRPDFIALFERQHEIAEYALLHGAREKHNEIAVIYDNESVHYASQGLDKLVLDFYRTSDLGKVGTGLDFYFHDDMKMPSMPDYKMYIMLNTYCLSDSEREAIYKKAAKNHATVVWMYASGFINPEGDTVMDVANIEKTIGMKLSMTEGLRFPYFRINSDSHPIVKYTDKYRRYGYIDRHVGSNVWIDSTVLQPTFVNPLLEIEEQEGITVLGRYCDGEKGAMAMHEYRGCTCVYIATPTVRSEVLSSVAAWSGCHIYSTDDDFIFANEHFLAIHTSYTGKHTIRFKKPCSPFELYEKKPYGENISEITLDLPIGETKTFLLDGIC